MQKLIFAVLLLVGSMSHAVSLTQNLADLAQTENSIFLTHGSDSKGAVLIAHGLNLRPSKMNALAEHYYKNGFDVYRLTLSGHEGDMAAFKEATAEKWLNEVVTAFNEMKSNEVGKPLHLLGFSLGGLAGFAAHERGLVAFDKIVLIAPPLQVTRTASLVRSLFGFPNMMLPSKNNVDYRVHPKTPIAAYIALFDLIDTLKVPATPLTAAKGLVFFSPQDEMVDTLKSTAFLSQTHAQWAIHNVEKSSATLKPVSYHLMIDEPSLGAKAFQEMLQKISEFIAAQ